MCALQKLIHPPDSFAALTKWAAGPATHTSYGIVSAEHLETMDFYQLTSKSYP